MSLITTLVSEENELRSIYQLRYKVYCYEWGFEKPGNYPDEMITDPYDLHALHFAVKDEARKIVGALSLILPSPEGFPAEKYCELEVDSGKLPGNSLAEISRLVIHRDYRRRREDKYIYGPDEERRSIGSFNYASGYANSVTRLRRSDDRYRNRNSRRSPESYSEKRKRHEVVISLYKAVYQESKRRQITHWYAVMTKGILGMLEKFGIIFDAIGDPVDYHGIRTPYLGVIEKIEKEIADSNQELYQEMTQGV